MAFSKLDSRLTFNWDDHGPTIFFSSHPVSCFTHVSTLKYALVIYDIKKDYWCTLAVNKLIPANIWSKKFWKLSQNSSSHNCLVLYFGN